MCWCDRGAGTELAWATSLVLRGKAQWFLVWRGITSVCNLCHNGTDYEMTLCQSAYARFSISQSMAIRFNTNVPLERAPWFNFFSDAWSRNGLRLSVCSLKTKCYISSSWQTLSTSTSCSIGLMPDLMYCVYWKHQKQAYFNFRFYSYHYWFFLKLFHPICYQFNFFSLKEFGKGSWQCLFVWLGNVYVSESYRSDISAVAKLSIYRS